MKHIHIPYIILLPILSASCSEKALEDNSIKNGISEITATLVEDDTKTVLADNEKNILWNPEDEINVFYEGFSVKFKSTNTMPEQTAVFKSYPTAFFNSTESATDTEAPYFVGTYPYNAGNSSDGESTTVTIPDQQIATICSFGPDSFVAIGRSKDTNIAFYNVCGGIRFTVKNDGINQITLAGKDGEILAGKVKVIFDGKLPKVSEVVDGKKSVTLTVPGGVFKAGEWYYVAVLPTVLKNGLNFVFDRIDAIGTGSCSINASVKRSTIGSLPAIDKNAEFTSVATDLSKNGTANCYIVSKEGRYTFNGTVKGGSFEPIGTAVSAEVLWESFGTDVAPEVGDIIERADFFDGNVSFATPSALKDGNAVIAVKDKSDNILWSWHIWVCKDYDPAASSQVYNNNAGTMMDRNLGATSATIGDVHALGLLYQWGRKDPFLSGGKISYDTYRDIPPAASTLSWPLAEDSSAHLEGNNTLSYSISHPTTRLKNDNELPFDWYCTSSSYRNDSLWSSKKTIYDPCPQGWRVPDGGDNGVWSKAFGSSSEYLYGPWDETNRGMDFGSGNGKPSNMQLGSSTIIWYPAAGMLSWSKDGSLCLWWLGENGQYWSCTPDDQCAHHFLLSYYKGGVYPSRDPSYRVSGLSVRCIAQPK